MSSNDRLDNIAAALGRVASGIFILTARHGEHETGMVASWVQQASFAPPMITIAVKHGRYIGDWIAESRAFAVSMLSEEQKFILSQFGAGFEPGVPAFADVEIERHSTGCPILSEALAYLDCRVTTEVTAGDHRVFVGEIAAGAVLHDDRPMIHVRRSGRHY
jgi:flavin reductase (DIM6/NTAB) family NADH-FMN oxidoreductase RutF